MRAHRARRLAALQPRHRGEQPGVVTSCVPIAAAESRDRVSSSRVLTSPARTARRAEDLPEEARIRAHAFDFGGLERVLQPLDARPTRSGAQAITLAIIGS